ncbi:TPA: hypothetical protein ACJ509_001693 [Stenotrophomonas maltophilia]
MNPVPENDVQQALNERRVRDEAARRSTDGAMRTARTLRWVGWACALVPVIGIFGVMFFVLGAFICFMYAHSKGNPDGLKNALLSLASAVVAGLVWLLVNLVVLGLFGAVLSTH